jgi:hypothetical protein
VAADFMHAVVGRPPPPPRRSGLTERLRHGGRDLHPLLCARDPSPA